MNKNSLYEKKNKECKNRKNVKENRKETGQNKMTTKN